MFEIIRSDIKRFQRHPHDNLTGELCFFVFTFGLHAVVVYRFGRWLLSLAGYPIYWLFLVLLFQIYMILSIVIRVFYDIHLDLSSDIGPGFYIGHFGGIRVGKCHIGSNCSIQQEVKLLPKEGGGLGPQIGSHVWIGAHAQIKGNVRIGDGATIGAGAFVTECVKANNLVLGNPARILGTNYDNSQIL